MNPHDHTRYAVGRIVKAFGIRGEVVVEPMTGDIARFKGLRTVHAGTTDASAARLTVSGVRIGGSGVRVTFEEVSDRTTAERLAGYYLFVDQDARITLPPGVFFVDDVVGMRVTGDDGREIGTVREVLHLPAQDVYVVATVRGECMIPAVKEFVRSIDVAGRTMTVHLIDGMMA